MRLFCLPFLACLLTACEGEPLTPADAVLPDGGRYRGVIVDGLLQGQGRLDYPNGASYQGQFKDGQWHGQGRWLGPTGDRYEGEFRNGLFHGQGRYSFADGSSFEGEFRQGSLNGQGSYHQQDLSYKGAFRDGLYHGLGTLKQDGGVIHHGEFVKGLPHGEGTRSEAQGQYSGHFSNDGLLEGEGTFTGHDGARYNGMFQAGQFHGQGRYEDAEGNAWIGEFEEGELNGEGQHIGADGTHYQGRFRGWRYHGKGSLSLADGRRHVGHFRRGHFDGQGELTLSDGTQQRGIWRQDRRTQDEHGQLLPDPLEVALLTQGELLSEAITALPASTAAAELYSLTFAGDGEQSVFLREADYVTRLMRERFSAHGQISLVNHRDHFTDRPLATRENLARAIQALAERSGPEDLLFMYFTSHGSADHRLALQQPRLALDDLPARELAQLLAPLAERHLVIVISACYSGGFIEPLQNARTLIITAARADRVSFGCAEQNDFTYFGRALFGEALQENPDIVQAFTLAQAKVAEREQADHYQPSEPQIWAPQQVVERWRALYGAPPAH